jgi:hypothetical protein
MRVIRLAIGLVLAAVSLSGCQKGQSSLTAPGPAPVPAIAPAPPGLPIGEGATIVVSATGFSPREVRLFQGSRLTVVNNDTTAHEILSDPLHIHSDCPAINSVGVVLPGQSRQSEPLATPRACGFHDHLQQGIAAFHGVAYVEEREQGAAGDLAGL